MLSNEECAVMFTRREGTWTFLKFKRCHSLLAIETVTIWQSTQIRSVSISSSTLPSQSCKDF